MIAFYAVPLGDVGDLTAEVIPWALLLMGLSVVGLVAALFLRRRMNSAADFHGDGFTFSDLRQLRKQGKINEVEYQRAKASLGASIGAGNLRAAGGNVSGVAPPMPPAEPPPQES